MKKLNGLLLMMVVLIYGASYVKAASYNTPVKSDMTYQECINFQDKLVTTSGSGYFGHCIKATAYNGVWQTQYYISSNMVTCTNGNTNKYYQIMADGCSKYVGQIGPNESKMQVKYCSIVAYYDCTKTSTGSPFITTTKATTLTTKTTTKRTTTAKTTKPTTTTTTTTKPSNPTEPKSSNSYLSSLSINPGVITFDKLTENYEVVVPEDTSYVEVIAVAEDTRATVVVENNEIISMDTPVIITVTAEDGTASVYTIWFKYGLDSNNRIALIDIENYEIDFDPEIYSYNLKIKKEEFLNINVQTESDLADYKILGNANLKNKSKISIVVTAEDASEATYIINIKKSSNIGGLFIVVIMLGVAGFVGYKIVTQFLLTKKEGESHYEYE